MPHSQGIYPNLPSFVERLNYAFENVPLSQSAVARKVGIAQVTFNKLLRGENKSSKELDKIAEVLGVDYQWLITGVSSEVLGESISFINIDLLENFDEYVNTRKLYSAKKPASTVQLDIRSLVNRQINFYDARYIPMPDAGMGMIINQDASVFFDKSHNFVEDGKSYVISHGGMLQVRQLFNAPLAGVKIQALNSMYESFTLDIDQQDSQLFQIIGQVFAVTNYY
ncbi:XRE family transcriptional regulator [Acinetobacter radioresistens]|uniref:XRE family transcriptional regulator n=1 Tax=Acinetobacter radioresistens TaxID=40216 RepID=UPI002006B57D|nr:S24 family peptidase [Acinetobacter radioresistens]MCK4090702.1 helix-turn-helix transcriptional regulator [Acinetobacter radioresistens]MCK4108869.1 helix-turn-helix transcriptional regulator [Acinetobacter radioresistens]